MWLQNQFMTFMRDALFMYSIKISNRYRLYFIMEELSAIQTQSHKIPKKKLTLTELKRFLPLQQPTCPPSLPPKIVQYLFSPSFSNLSLSQQKNIQSKYQIAYRHYYGIEDIVEYLNSLTESKYTKSSIRRAICNCAEKYGVVDWYKIVRKVMSNQQIGIKEDEVSEKKNEDKQQIKVRLIYEIKNLFKQYKQKRIIWKGVEQVAETKNNLQPRVMVQLIREAVNEIKQQIQKNRIASEKILYEYEKKYDKTTFVTLQQLINQDLQLYMDKKKCIYIYLHFDEPNKGYFKTHNLMDELLVVKKIKMPTIKPEYLIDPSELMQQIRAECNAAFETASELKNAFLQIYQKSQQNQQTEPPLPEQEIPEKLLYKFLSIHLQDKYSRYQSNLILKELQYFGNVHFLYNKPKPLQLSSIISRFTMKNQSARRKLKKQNEVFYSFREIILHLLSRRKEDKISREKFTEFITSIDPRLKYDAFYCVWRVYPSIINLKRMKQISKLNPFACYLKLKKRNEEEYFKVYEDLIDQYPEGTQVMYEKVQEKINFVLDYMLQHSKIVAANHDRYDQVNYRQTIRQILQPDFEIMIRRYIFTKVAEKTYAMWNAYLKRKQAMKIMEGLKKMMIPSQSKKSLDSKGMSKKLATSKSKGSMLSKKSEVKVSPETLEIVKWNLMKIIDELDCKQKYQHKQFHKDQYQRYHLSINLQQKYIYRTLTPRISLHTLVGIVAYSQQLLFLKNNTLETIKTKFLHKPGIEVIDFTTNTMNDIIMLTSYFTLQFYNLSQNTSYSYKTIQLLDDVQQMTNADFEDICEDRVFSKFPIMVRTYGNLILVNTSVINDQIIIINTESEQRVGQISLWQRQHTFNSITQKILTIIKQHQKKNEIITSILQNIGKPGSITQKQLESIFQTVANQEQFITEQSEKLEKVTLKERKEFVKNITKYNNSAMSILVLKEEFEMMKSRIMPESLLQVLQALRAQLKLRNISIYDMLLTIDRQNTGLVKMKSFKDYLLKITQEAFIGNQKQIDNYLKDMCVGKNVTYETIYQIIMVLKWPFKIWERPYMVVKDFIYEESSKLLFYTVEGEIDVYIRNVEDSLLIGILKGHSRIPQMHFIQEGMLLITGDDESIRIWRIFQDFIKKYDENPPWEMSPIYTLKNAHDDCITSISYLPRANCLVTTSLDSTLKFWKLSYEQQQIENDESKQQKASKDKSLKLKQQIRIYSEEHLYISSKVSLLNVNAGSKEHPCFLQKIAISKLNKQINENNKYKLEMTVEVYHIQNIKLQTGTDNIYIEKLPQKLVNEIQSFTRDVLGQKKQILYQKWAKQEQISIQKINLVTKSLERGLYEAVKKFFIFGNHTQLLRIAKFLGKKNDKGFMIYKVLFDEYGLRVIQKKHLAPLISQAQIQINKKLLQTTADIINLPDEQIELIFKKIKRVSQGKEEHMSISYEQLMEIIKQFLFGSQFEKFEQIIEQFLRNRKQSSKEGMMIRVSQLKKYLKGYALESDIDRFYLLLRQMQMSLKNKGLKVWELFSSHKKQLDKRSKISGKEFKRRALELGFSEKNIKVLYSYLSKNEQIYFSQLVYFFKLANQATSEQLIDTSNLSKTILKNSRLLQSRLYSYNQENDPEANKEPTLQDKIKMLESLVRQSGLNRDSSRKSSMKKIKLSAKISESESVQDTNKSVKSADKSREKSIPRKVENELMKSYNVSSSGSRLSLSRESNAKDSVAREALGIVKDMKQRLKNENKSIWDIISLTIPDFMEISFISQTQYFNIFKALNSPIYLSEKIKLLKFIWRQSGQFSNISLNLLFQLFENLNIFGSKSKNILSLPGQKYIFSHIVGKLTENKMKLEHSVTQRFFKQKDELSIDELLQILGEEPFNLLGFCLREMEVLLYSQNKSAFVSEEIHALIMEKISKYNIKVQAQEIGYLDELIYRIEMKKQILEELLPKQETQQTNGKINYQIFKAMITKFFKEKEVIIENQFIKLISKQNELQMQQNSLRESPKKSSSVSPKKIAKKLPLKTISNLSHRQILQNQQIKYKDFLNVIKNLMEDLKISNDWEKDTLRKFIKCLETKKINFLTFFKGLDPNMNYYINQVQFTSGLTELKITDNFWPHIKKKFPKRLYYNQLITYLTEKGVVDYKCIDSELEAAMSKFMKRFMRNDDIEIVYDRIRAKQSEQSYNVSFESFDKALKNGNLFNDQQIFYIFSAFVNSQNLKLSKFSNDDIIKDPANLRKVFNFKMFTDTINRYRNQNITKNPLYKLSQWFKKRNISVLNQFLKWMERNKKIKQIGEALKNKQTSLPKQHFASFIRDFHSGLLQRQIKQIISPFKENIQFSAFNQKLQQIYKKGTINIQAEEVNNFLKIIFKRIQTLKVSAERLYKDFTKNSGFMNLMDFSSVVSFLEIGLTKIQMRQIFQGIDLEKKGYITLQELEDGLESAAENLEKEKEDIELQNILQKIFLNRDKFSLKASRITFTFDRACLVFSKILTTEQTQVLYIQAQQHLKLMELSQKNLQQYLKLKETQFRAKKDKKYKELTLKFLSFIKRINLEVSEIYHYFAKDTNSLNKNKFLILYQSLELKCNIVEINALYSYLDQNKTGYITLSTWEDKLNMIQYYSKETQSEGGADNELQIFYKVKLQLSEIYLIFVRKLFKQKQIYAFFDFNGNGKISHDEFLSSIASLGLTMDENMQLRMLNYLDKYKTGEIQISNIVKQLENCLASKSKLILQTRTSCIFKEKVHLIQEKQEYFLEKLVQLQYFVIAKGILTSAILQTDFIAMIRDFGIILGEDQLNDIERNFSLTKDNLSLYPLYFMFANIFKSAQFTFTAEEMERKRFQKLFESLVKNNITMKIFDKIHTKTEAQNFLLQLKIFTPIQVKLIIEKIALPETSLIDKHQLAYRIRNSFLTNKNKNNLTDFNLTASNISQDEKLRRQLRALIDPAQIIEILKATSGKIYEDTFVKLLEKIDLVFTKKQSHEYFQAMSNRKQFVLLEEMLAKPVEQEFFMEESQPFLDLGQNELALNIHEKSEQQIYEEKLQILLNHICKQLDFKGVSLEEAWEKYYENFGYISRTNLYKMLDEIGFNYKQDPYKEIVSELLVKMEEETGQKQIKREYFEELMGQYQQYPKKKSKTGKYLIILTILKQISESLVIDGKLDIFLLDLEKYVLEETGKDEIISAQVFLNYLKQYYLQLKQRKLSESQLKYLKFMTSSIMQAKEIPTPLLLKKLKKKLTQYLNRIKKSVLTHTEEQDEDEEIIVKDPSAPLLETKFAMTAKVIDSAQLIRVCEHNFIWNYQEEVQKLDGRVNSIVSPLTNLHRIASNLLCEQLLSNPYLFEVSFHLTPTQEQTLPLKKQEPQSLNPISKYKSVSLSSMPSRSVNLTPMNNIIIQSEDPIPGTDIFLINDKFYAYPTPNNVRAPQKSFQYLSQATTILHPEYQYFRAKNYYLWQPIKSVMPKCAINYRWKFIPNFIVSLAKQFKLLQESGFSIPHLKWDGLCKSTGIREVGFPSKIHSNGQYIEEVSHKSLLTLEHPYTAPQFFIKLSNKKKQQDRLTGKVDVWVFGCLLYEFVWGHSPQSFILELLNYVKNRVTDIQLTETLQIHQLPSDFDYVPLNFKKINETLCLQHELRAVRSDGEDFQTNIKLIGYRGIIKQLQIMYGQELMYYKQQIQLFQSIMATVVRCLNPHHWQRPSFDSIINEYEPIICIEEQYREFLQVLEVHEPTLPIIDSIVNPLFELFESKEESVDAKKLKEIIKKLEKTTKQCLNNKNIRQIYTIPKYYPWPEEYDLMPNDSIGNNTLSNPQKISLINPSLLKSSQFSEQTQYSFDKQVLKNKSAIRTNLCYNVMSILANEQCYEILANLCLKVEKDDPLSEQLLQRVFNIMMVMVESIRDYQSMLVGHIGPILQVIVQLIFEQQFSFIRRQFDSQSISPSSIKHQLKPINLTASKHKCINYLKKIIYINGTGNIQYLPIKDFLEYHYDYRLMFEYFYAAINLECSQVHEQYLGVNYFIDHIEEQGPEADLFWEVIQYFRVPITIVRLLSKSTDTQLLKTILHLLLQFSNHSSRNISIFFTLPLYLHLNKYLHTSLIYPDSPAIKTQVIDIITNLISSSGYSQKILKILSSPSCNTLANILKLMIEPSTNISAEGDGQTVLHQEFWQLLPCLSNFLRVVEQNSGYLQKIQRESGAQFILDSFRKKTQTQFPM